MTDIDQTRRTFLKLVGAGVAAMAFPGGCRMASTIHKPRIGLQLYSVRRQLETDFDQAIKKVAAIGFAGVELFALPPGITPEHARRVCERTVSRFWGCTLSCLRARQETACWNSPMSLAVSGSSTPGGRKEKDTRREMLAGGLRTCMMRSRPSSPARGFGSGSTITGGNSRNGTESSLSIISWSTLTEGHSLRLTPTGRKRQVPTR